MKRILVTGGSGFIGRRLASELVARGDLVTVLTRDVDKTKKRLPSAVRVAAWNPEKQGPWFEELDVVDAVVHLAGENVVQRWSDERKKRIVASRVESTRLLVEAIGQAKHKPAVLVSASGTGYYGPHPASEELDESSPKGSDFLADLADQWESAAREAEKHGVRTVQLRIGVVFGEGGGALEKMARQFNMYMGGPIGKGTQPVSWVHRDDVVGMILFAIDNPEVKGAVNCVSPYPATSQELAESLGIVLHKPTWFRTPEALLKLAIGDAADVMLSGQRVLPRKAAELGYEFRQARLLRALESILGT